MRNYTLEIEKIKNIQRDYSKLTDLELQSYLYEVCGITLISIQQTEYTILGIVSHFNENLLQNNNQFKKLTPRIFLDNDEISRKNRKQTLGTIINFVLSTTDLFKQSELETYVDNRNKFVHNFWREFLSHNRITERDEILKSLNFLIDFIKDDIKWQTIFKGFLYAIVRIVSEREKKDLSKFAYLEKYYSDFLEYVNQIKYN